MESLIYYPSCPSTQDEIINFINRHDCGEFLGVYTFNQTQGRGQYGNLWESAPGENLAYSFALASQNLKLPFVTLNFYTAMLIREFIANLTQSEVFIKWPNDLILCDKKICGMLFEKKGPHFIAGIGINMLQQNFEHLPKAGSLLTQTGKAFDPKTIAESLHGFLAQKFSALPATEAILEAYNQHLYRKEKISVFEKNRVRQNGIIRQVDAQGFLWVELEEEGLQKFYHKEIELFY